MLTLLLASLLFASPPPQAVQAQLRVATFNIRLGTAEDGENRWEKRKGRCFDTIRRMDPDLIGLQEVLAFQLDELKTALPGYEFVGAGREDGKRGGEFVPVGFKSKRFERIDDGHFWLSETPDEPGSRGWDAKLPRMATWVRLKEREGSRRTLLFVNTHFDHIGRQARLESAKLVRVRVEKRQEGGEPLVLVGDFNATEDDPPYTALVDGERLIDSFRAAHPQRGKDEGTAHGFTGDRSRGRIDWILHRPDFRTVSCEIVHSSDGNRYPSDHFPVLAVLELAAAR
jgi:endonuclease/exonuclease/phosphatase family metal-dependent hydrolase